MNEEKRDESCPWARKIAVPYSNVTDVIEPTLVPLFDELYTKLKEQGAIDRNGWCKGTYDIIVVKRSNEKE